MPQCHNMRGADYAMPPVLAYKLVSPEQSSQHMLVLGRA